MINIEFYWSKILKKLRGASVKNSKVHVTSKIESGSNVVNTEMGKHSFCGYDCEITNAKIGSFCSIANGVVIGGGMHPIDWAATSPVFYEGRDSVKKKFSTHRRKPMLQTVVEHDVWIGQNALIKQGVTIGIGAVVGMGSIVTKDVKPYTVVAGNPARVIKNRFRDEVIEKLLETKWWEQNENMLKKHAVFVTNPSQFIDSIENER